MFMPCMMKRLLLILLALLAVCSATAQSNVLFYLPSPPAVPLYGSLFNTLSNAVSLAQTNVVFIGENVSNPDFVQLLIDTKQRGIDVSILADFRPAYAQNNKFKKLAAYGITNRLDHSHTLLDVRMVIIDHSVLVTGSYRFSETSRVFTNQYLLFLYDTNLAAQFYQVHDAVRVGTRFSRF